MDGVLIDERRIHVDFSQSVSKLWNTFRRKQLKETAQIIIERDQALKQKQLKTVDPFYKERKGESTNNHRYDGGKGKSSSGRKDDP